MLLPLFLLTGMTATATVFTVTNNNDAGAGSLRSAIAGANAGGAGPHSIVFSTSGTINLASALPGITNANVTIDGGNAIVVSANVGNVVRDVFTISAGGTNATLKNMILQNTGSNCVTIAANVNGVTIQGITMRNNIGDWTNNGIQVLGVSNNLTIRNVTMTNIEDAQRGVRFNGNVSNLMIDGLHVYKGTGTTGVAIHFIGTVTNSTIRNSILDLSDPATTNDGDYGIYCASTVNGLTIDSTQILSAEVNAIHFRNIVSNLSIRNSNFTNPDGTGTAVAIRFDSTLSVGRVFNNTFNGKMAAGTDRADMAFDIKDHMQRVIIRGNTFTEYDLRGIYSEYGYNTDSLLVDSNQFSRMGNGTGTGAIELAGMRTTSSDAFPIIITRNTLTGVNGIAIYLRPGDGGNYAIPNTTVSLNTITGQKTTFGAIRFNYIDKIKVTQNSVYGNQGIGIDLAGAANCGYEGTANIPQLLSSAETTPGSGVYNLVVKMPTVCATGKCTLELFSTAASVTGAIGGQHYVKTVTGLSAGNNNISNVTAAFPEITTAPYGRWTATLIVANNCGTSEYSNKLPIKVNGPAGVDAGVKLWLNPDFLDPGNLVAGTGWEDFSGNSKNFDIVSSDPANAAAKLNYNNYVEFDGNDYLRCSTSPFVNTFTAGEAITVVRSYSNNANRGNPYDFGSGNRGSHYTWGDANVYNGFGTTDRNGWNPQAMTTSELKTGASLSGKPVNPLAWNIYGTHSVAGNWGVDFNGGQQTVSSATNAVSFALASGNEHVGAISGTIFYGGISEEVLYNRVLTTVERQRINSYLAVKYGLTLNQNYIASDSTTIWWNIANNAGYNKGIAGIARDDRSVLYQRQSTSVSASDVISIGVGDQILATNADNDGTIRNNKSAFMWGTDSASTLYSTAYVTPYSDARMVRVWRVRKTNWNDTLIVIRLKGGNRNRSLIVSNVPTFATGVTTYPLNDTGAVILSSAAFADGAYFSFANKISAPGCVTAGIQAWYKADDANASAAEWTDYSGYDRSATQATAAAQPVKVASSLNFNPSFNFDGSADYMDIASNLNINGTNNMTVISISKRETVGTVDGILGQQGITNNNYLYYFRADNKLGIGATNVSSVGSTGTYATANIPYLNAITRSGNNYALYTNGAADGTSSVAYTFTAANMRIGNRSTSADAAFDGDINELIVYNRALNATELQKVSSYLSLKYGMTMNSGTQDYLASDTSVKMWKASDNAAFNKNIAGIGKDSCSVLFHQKQSKSVNAGSLLTVALGDFIPNTNAENTANVTNNLSFLTWGDNGGATTFTTNVTAPTATVRMPRAWRVDKTNWADQTVTMKFDGGARNTYLIISNSSAAFSTVDQEIAVNEADSTITLNTSLLPDGAYFTFAREIKGPGFVNSGVQIWLRADDGSSTPDSWNDYSGNASDATIVAAGSQPTFVDSGFNYNPVFRFNGTTAQLMAAYKAGFNGNISTFAVYQQSAGSSYRAPMSSRVVVSNQAKGWNYYLNANTREFWTGNNSTNWDVRTAGTYTNKIPELVGMTATLGAGTAAKTTYVNGLQVQNLATATYITNPSAPLYIGSIGNAAYWNGDIAEAVVYNRVISAKERQIVSSYLAVKYGITQDQTTATDYLATDSSVVWKASDNTGYSSNIVAVGRDDQTGLNQKQTVSVTDGLLTMAVGDAVAQTNTANTESVDDRSFFFIANNNGAATYSVTVNGLANATTRMPRVWKVDRTSNWSDQNLTFKVAKGGDRYLLVNATDATFATGSVEYPISTATGTVTINTADIPDGAFITLATKIVGPGAVSTGVTAWLRADYAATGSSWIDYSGNQQHAAQATVAAQPAVVASGINYNPALDFNGSASYMDFSGNLSVTGTAPFTLVGMGLRESTGTWDVFVSHNNTSGALSYGYSAGNAIAINKAATGNILLSPTLYTSTTTPYFITATRTGNNFAFYANGKADGTGTSTESFTASNMRLGNRAASADLAFDGKIAEVAVYNRALSATELQRVHSYLALKYGITMNGGANDYLASNGTTKMWSAANNAGYNYRITGIGRDDSTALYQKQSLNVEGGLVTIAQGLIASGNDANDAAIDSNNSYLVFGDNNAALTYSTAVDAPTATYRMNRVWKVDKTNWSDNDITLKLKRRTVNTFLLISSSPTFATVDQELPLTPDDSTVNLNSSMLPDSVYFTFGSRLYVPGGVAATNLWLRPDVGTSSNTDSTTFDTWTDNSPSGNDAVQATAGSQPLYSDNAKSNINFNPVVLFNGTSQTMSLDVSLMPLGTTARTLITTARPATIAGGTDYVIGWGAATAANGNGMANVAGAGNFVGYGGNDVSSAGFWQANVVNTLEGTWAGGTGTAALYNRMLQKATLARSWNTTTTAGAAIGNFPTTAQYWQGAIGDVIVYNRELTASERLRISTYLAIKYGTSIDQTTATNYLATDSSVIWDATANATYKYGITGLGRDDKEALLQKQSRHSDTTRMRIAIGVGALAETNNANNKGIDDDVSYLVWGDDNGATTFNTSVAGTALANYRMTRVWKNQESGSIGTVQIAVPAASVPNQDEAYLVVSNDNVFDSADNYIGLSPVTINSVKYLAGTVDLTSGQFFTFAANLKMPGGVATPALWMRSDKGIDNNTDGASVDVWVDYTNEVNSATQTTPANQPLYKNNAASNINYNPVVNFAGSPVSMTLDATKLPLTSSARTVIGFGTPANVTGVKHMIGWGTNASLQYSALGANAAAGVFSTAYTTHSLSAGSFWTAGVPNEMMTTYAGGTSGAAALYSRMKSLANTTLTLNTGATIATLGNGGGFWTGDIGEVIVYNRAINATERKQISSYLAIKYGYTLDQTSPTDYLSTDSTQKIWDATVNASYKYSITGIGRDDVEGLLQKQSRNIDTSRLAIAVGVNEIAGTNVDNSGTLGDGQSYLVWGDDNGVTTFRTAVSGNSNVNYRMTRVWKVQETGLVGDVQVAYPFEVLPNPTQSYLVVSDDNTFDGTDTYYALKLVTVNGRKFYAANVDINDAQYFTVAAFIKSPGGIGMPALWLRADRGVEDDVDGTVVPTWVDYANQVNNGSQATAAAQSTYANNTTDNINYNPVMKLDGGDNFVLDISKLPTGNTARTIIGYGATSTIAAGQRYMIGWGTNTTPQFIGLGQNAAAGVLSTAYTTYNISAAAQWAANTPNELFATYAGGTGGATHLYSKGKEIGTAATASLTTLAGGTAYLGSSGGAAANNWTGKLGDVIVFDKLLTLNERLRVGTYVSLKYGYTMDQTTATPYIATSGDTVWNPAANGLYRNRISGIGRDDIEGFDQRQSSSTETGSVLAMGLGSIATTNVDNANTFGSDTSYVIVADNNGALAEQTTELPATVAAGSKRIGREWKASVKTSTESMQLKFDLSSTTVTGTVPADFTLLIDTDGDGDFTTGTVTQKSATSFASGTLVFDGVTLGNGQVFTVVTKLQSYKLNVKAYLQGAMPSSGTRMNNYLQDYYGDNSFGLLPENDPYAEIANYASINDTAGAAGAVVDWVKVEVRSASNPASVIETNHWLLKTNGSIVDVTGAVPTLTTTSLPDSVFITVSHRNHLSVMSKKLSGTASSTLTYDFTTALSQAYNPFGDPAQMVQKNGVWCLWAGDLNGDYFIDGTDYGKIYFDNSNAPYDVYHLSDLNMDGVVDGSDLGLIYFNNSISPYSTIVNY